MIRLKQLRLENNKNMKETAQLLGMPYTTYISYEKEDREPNSETLIRFAEFYDVSVDYLVGNSDKRKITLQEFLDSEEEKRDKLGVSKKEWDLMMRYRYATEKEKTIIDTLLGLDQE